MSSAEGQTNPIAPRRRGSFARLARRFALIFGLASLAGFGAGFLSFVSQFDQLEASHLREADGAVALTGGTDRIADAVNLVSKGYAGRLLITGVNQATSGAEIARLTPKFADLVGCCIDLGYDALNTRGNASEARRWARGRGMHSLILVTSTYHMPRALIEFSSVLPDVELIPYPVVPERLRAGAWWVDPGMARLLAFEYVKYLVAAARVRVFGPDEMPVAKTMTAKG